MLSKLPILSSRSSIQPKSACSVPSPSQTSSALANGKITSESLEGVGGKLFRSATRVLFYIMFTSKVCLNALLDQCAFCVSEREWKFAGEVYLQSLLLTCMQQETWVKTGNSMIIAMINLTICPAHGWKPCWRSHMIRSTISQCNP